MKPLILYFVFAVKCYTRPFPDIYLQKIFIDERSNKTTRSKCQILGKTQVTFTGSCCQQFVLLNIDFQQELGEMRCFLSSTGHSQNPQSVTSCLFCDERYQVKLIQVWHLLKSSIIEASFGVSQYRKSNYCRTYLKRQFQTQFHRDRKKVTGEKWTVKSGIMIQPVTFKMQETAKGPRFRGFTSHLKARGCWLWPSLPPKAEALYSCVVGRAHYCIHESLTTTTLPVWEPLASVDGSHFN